MFISFNVYGILIVRWASNSKYTLISAIRTVAQAISYEVVLGTGVLVLILFTRDSSFYPYRRYISRYMFYFTSLVVFSVCLVGLIIESNRPPFDLAECESELVSGFNVEYGAVEFSLIFLGENLIVVAASIFMVMTFFNFFFTIIILYFFT